MRLRLHVMRCPACCCCIVLTAAAIARVPTRSPCLCMPLRSVCKERGVWASCMFRIAVRGVLLLPRSGVRSCCRRVVVFFGNAYIVLTSPDSAAAILAPRSKVSPLRCGHSSTVVVTADTAAARGPRRRRASGQKQVVACFTTAVDSFTMICLLRHVLTRCRCERVLPSFLAPPLRLSTTGMHANSACVCLQFVCPPAAALIKRLAG